MDEWLQEMRAAAKTETASMENDDESVDPRVEEILDSFFSGMPETNEFVVALDVLAEETAWGDAPAGKAAASARGMAEDRTTSGVVDALGVPRRRARHAIEQTLGLTQDAADLLLDRPVAVLLTFEPDSVRRLADACENAPGQLFAQVASSSRGASGYVYAYRPGVHPTAPARRAAEPSATLPLLDWGLRFFGLRPRRAR